MSEYNPDFEVVFDLRVLKQGREDVTDEMIKQVVEAINDSDYVYDHVIEYADEILEEEILK